VDEVVCAIVDEDLWRSKIVESAPELTQLGAVLVAQDDLDHSDGGPMVSALVGHRQHGVGDEHTDHLAATSGQPPPAFA